MRAIEEVSFAPRDGDPRSPGKGNLVVVVVVVGTDAWVLAPLTSDHAAVDALLRKAAIGQINSNGTELGTAILKGASLVDTPRVPREGDARDDPARDDAARTIVVITDGNVGEAPEKVDSLEATRVAASKRTRVSVVMIDDRDEAVVETGVDLFGKAVRTKAKFPVNRTLLDLCVREGHGRFFLATQTDRDGLDRELGWAFPR